MYSMFNPSLPIKGKFNLNPPTLPVTIFKKLYSTRNIAPSPKDFVTLQITFLPCNHFLRLYELYLTFFYNSGVTYAKFLHVLSVDIVILVQNIKAIG